MAKTGSQFFEQFILQLRWRGPGGAFLLKTNVKVPAGVENTPFHNAAHDIGNNSHRRGKWLQLHKKISLYPEVQSLAIISDPLVGCRGRTFTERGDLADD